MDFLLFQEKIKEFFVFLEAEKNVSAHTLRAYHLDLVQLQRFWEKLEHTNNQAYQLRHVIERFLINLYHNKADKTTIARKLSCIQSFERFLLRHNIILDLKLQRPRLDKKLPVYLSIDELFYLLDTIKISEIPSQFPYRDRAILELLYATGIRCSELVMIKLQDIDMHQKIIKIQGKGNKERIVLFGSKAQERLQDYLLKERPQPFDAQEPLFLNFRDQMLTSRSVQRILAMFRMFLKIPRSITPHKIRHSFATHLLNEGADLRLIQELLGHKSISSTEKYVHLSTTQLAQVCDATHPLKTLAKTKNKCHK